MAKVKGVALLSRVVVIKEHYGDDALEAVMGRMKSQHREMLGGAIPSSWYDAEIFRDFNRAIQEALSAKDPEVMEHIGEYTAEAGLKGIYSSRLKADDVRRTLARAGSLWKTFHDTGELTVEIDPDRNYGVFRVIDYALPHEENCRNLVGWGRRMVELSGGTNVRVARDKCVCRGDDHCEMTVEWD